MATHQVNEADYQNLTIEHVLASSSEEPKRLVFSFDFKTYTWVYRVQVKQDWHTFDYLNDAIECYNSNGTLHSYARVKE